MNIKTKRIAIRTELAPSAIGAYSQAIVHADTVYISGQIPLDPNTMEVVSEDFREQALRVFENLQAVAHAANSSLDQALKLTVYLTDLDNFATLNEVMADYCREPFPARAAVEVAGLPKGVQIEIDAILCLA